MLVKIPLFFISIYQRTLSPDHGILKGRYPYGFCRFYPSCSEYARLSLIKHGFRKGLMLSVARIARCNPFSKPAVDNV